MEIRDSSNEEQWPMPDDDFNNGAFTRAKLIAQLAHRGQVDKAGNDYMLHVERVVRLTSEAYGEGWDERVLAVAWLHDVLEDSILTAADLQTLLFTSEVIDAVCLLTRVHDPHEPYAAYIKRVVQSGNWLALIVKQADLQDHLTSGVCPGHLRQRYVSALEKISAALKETPRPELPQDVDAVDPHAANQQRLTTRDSYCSHCTDQSSAIAQIVQEMRTVVRQVGRAGQVGPYAFQVPYEHVDAWADRLDAVGAERMTQ